jgi:hypothetical protein
MGAVRPSDYTQEPFGRLTDDSVNGSLTGHHEQDANSNRLRGVKTNSGTSTDWVGTYKVQRRLLAYGPIHGRGGQPAPEQSRLIKLVKLLDKATKSSVR